MAVSVVRYLEAECDVCGKYANTAGDDGLPEGWRVELGGGEWGSWEEVEMPASGEVYLAVCPDCDPGDVAE